MVLQNLSLVHRVNLEGEIYLTVRLFHDTFNPCKKLNVTSRKIKELENIESLEKSGDIVVYDLDKAKKQKNKHISELIRYTNNYQPLMLIKKSFGEHLSKMLAEEQDKSKAIEAELVEEEIQNGKVNSDISKLVRINDEGKVFAREIWSFLESKSDYRKWFKRRADDLGLKIPNDYKVVIFDLPNQGTPKIEHEISIDLGKELAMLERNERGKQLRKYFIEAEKKLRQVAQASRLESEPQEQTIETKLAQAAIAAKKLKEIYDITGVKGAGASDAIYKFLNQEYQINLVTPDANAQQELPTLSELPPAHSEWVTPTKLGGYLGKIAEKSISGKEMNQILCEAKLQKGSGPRGGAPFTPTEKAKGLYAQTQTHISNHNGTKLKQSLVWDLEKTAEIMIDYVQ